MNGRGRLGPIAAALVALASLPAVARGAENAVRIGPGSIARSQVVALGRDLEIAGEAMADAAAINASARIEGRVHGSLVVLGGAARLGAAAVVDGDVFVLGGELEAADGARIGGRAVAYPSVREAWLVLLEGPGLGLSAAAPVVLGAKLALLAAWLALALFVIAAGGREVLATAQAVREEPLAAFATGLTGVLAAFLTALFLASVAPPAATLPLLVLVVLAALLAKLWGMIAIFQALGDWVARRVLGRRPRPLDAACLGLLLLGGLKFLPWAGVVLWWAASLVGVGAALRTKFGRREPWFEAGTAGVALP
jgi:hypothetical protein